jgi:hypothetical protein
LGGGFGSASVFAPRITGYIGQKIDSLTTRLNTPTGIKNGTLNETGNKIQDLLYGARAGEGLPGATGVKISSRPTISELENLTAKHGVEFATIYKLGPNANGGGGQYILYSGTKKSVSIPIDKDTILVNHTHPGGAAFASEGDIKVLNALKKVGSPQRSSEIIPLGKAPVRFGSGK